MVVSTADFSIINSFNLYHNVDWIAHPEAYLNKVILYSKDQMILFNFNTGKELYNYAK